MRYQPVTIADQVKAYAAATNSEARLSDRVRIIASLVLTPRSEGCQDDFLQQALLQAAAQLEGKGDDGHGDLVVTPDNPPVIPVGEQLAVPDAGVTPKDLLKHLIENGGESIMHLASGTIVVFGKNLPADLLIELWKQKANIVALFREMTPPNTEEDNIPLQDSIVLYRKQRGFTPEVLTYTI